MRHGHFRLPSVFSIVTPYSRTVDDGERETE
jgi:hypothetical protein